MNFWTGRVVINFMNFPGWTKFRCASLIISALFLYGFGGLFGVSPVTPVRLEPFLDKVGKLTIARLIAPVEGGTLAAVVINFEGHHLTADSANMYIEKPLQGSPREVIGDEIEAFHFRLSEVKNNNGKILGYFLVREGRLEGQYLDNDETLVLTGEEPTLP